MALQTVNVARMGAELPDAAPIGLSKENFLVQLLTNWSQTLEDAAGLEEASGMISVVGGMIGLQINQEYRQHFGRDLMDRELVAQVLVDLKRRIDGGFSIECITDEAIAIDDLIRDPVEVVAGFEQIPHPRIPLPVALYRSQGQERDNSMGINLANDDELRALATQINNAGSGSWTAAPLVPVAPPPPPAGDGRIERVWDKVKVKGHAQEVLDAIAG